MIIFDVLQTTKGKNCMEGKLELPANLLFREGKFLFWYHSVSSSSLCAPVPVWAQAQEPFPSLYIGFNLKNILLSESQ